MSLTSDLLELSRHLQQEHLFVTTEREQLQRLYHNVTILSEKLFHTAWIARQQKQNLQYFIDQGNNAGENVEVYSTNNQLEESHFIDSYKVFSYHDSKYGDLLRFLYENPHLLANIIYEAEKNGGLNVQRMIGLIVTSIYGNCIFQEDEKVVLLLLKTLLVCQLADSENPRRLIRRQNLSFSLVYKHLCETLFSARLFLTAALYEPIMRLLMEDEWFFDIDPDKALVRFPPTEKLRRFGEPGSEEYNMKQAQYRSFIVDKLVMLAIKFINSIKANMHCFPASLGWLVSQVYRVLTERGKVSMQEIRVCCADLVFALFICPAICDPEPHGITSDVPISHIARHNLMQMAQIIQVLAISQFEEIDPKVRDLYSRFEKGCMASVLDIFLEGPWEEFTEQISFDRQKSSAGATRSAVLLTPRDVREMIGFLRSTTVHLDEGTSNKKTLEQLLSVLPADMPPSLVDNLSNPGGGVVATPSTPGTGSSTQTPDTPGTPNSERKLFKSKGTRKRRTTTSSLNFEEALADGTDNDNKAKPSDVLVISIYPPGDCLGLLPEKKIVLLVQHKYLNSYLNITVLSSVLDSEVKQVPSHPVPPSDPVPVVTPQAAPNPEIQEKRTRFSLSHDQESIGNASDYQEVISEAASSHSVEDENELETDNFSDMMSANVSGRGSPSISGRDTPLSQAGSVEENPPPPQLPVPVPETVRKENRVDVTERFGKFEIKADLAMERDECKSTVSDTWSTDVLASDSEPPEQNQVDRLEEVAEEIIRPLVLGSEPISEISETASDAWSTDVLASDTEEKHSELLKDLEQDLITGILDRDEGDSSLGHDEIIDESALELDQLGAVGGGGNSQMSLEANDSFSDVFVEMSGKSMDDSERMGNGKKISSIVHHFQSGPNLQLPSIHRVPSQSLKHVEGRVTSVVGTFESNSPTGSTATSTSTIIHPSTGARSKVREKKKEREGRLSIGGGDDGMSEFDPLSSSGAAGGFKKSKDRWNWSRNSNASSDHSKSSHADDQDLPVASATAASHGFPTPPSGGQGDHTSSRDSGIDIWVSTNGQISGSSTRSTSTALLNTRSSFDSMSHRHVAPPLPGRSSLDSNLQRLHSVSGRGMSGIPSTADSGIPSSYVSTVSSSLDNNTPPLEIDNPLFRLMNSESSAAAQNHNSRALAFDSSLNQLDRTSDSSLNQLDRTSKESLTILDPTAENNPEFLVDDKYSSVKSTPQIEVTDIFKKISVVDEGDQTDIDIPNTGEQRVSNVNERRLSSALTLFDPFASEAEEASGDLTAAAGLTKDLSFDGSVRFLDQEAQLPKSSDSFYSKQSNGMVVMVDESHNVDQGVADQKGHSRQDSSGSNQSASSLKLNTAYETTTKQPASDITEDKDLDGDKNRKVSSVGFLRTMKDKFNKGIKRKNAKVEKDSDACEGEGSRVHKPTLQGITAKDGLTQFTADGTDDILAKYRTPKKPLQKQINNTASSGIIINNNTSTINNNTSKSEYTEVTAVGSSHASTSAGSSRNSDSHHMLDDSGPCFFNQDNLEGCAAFQDAKRKLRLVLSMADVTFGLSQIHSSSPREGASSRENELINILNTQLAEAINLQNKDLVAQLYEVIRCMKMFDTDGCRKLIQSMKEDYSRRSPYISYLVRCRQGLLSTRNQLQRLLNRVTRDKEICNKHLTNMCARNFLEKREKIMWMFINDFQKLSVSDEKTDLMERFLQNLYQEMSTDALWKAANSTQIEDGQQAIERFLMSRIYTHAMFPNGDGDIMRDQVLQEHLRKLSKIITPLHKDLRIPSMYHLECPWPAAQKEIFMINAYRTPKDKIRCVLRCSQTIMNLLSMANEKSVPAADDFMPVLIYVLIKANPFGLLSTIQYVNSFYEKRLHGEEQYWWLQLTSAVEFIKTMEYSS